jgi:hypothetical protein
LVTGNHDHAFASSLPKPPSRLIGESFPKWPKDPRTLQSCSRSPFLYTFFNFQTVRIFHRRHLRRELAWRSQYLRSKTSGYAWTVPSSSIVPTERLSFVRVFTIPISGKVTSNTLAAEDKQVPRQLSPPSPNSANQMKAPIELEAGEGPLEASPRAGAEGARRRPLDVGTGKSSLITRPCQHVFGEVWEQQRGGG